MNRKNFIKNSLMALAVSLLPKVLRPADGELCDDGDLINPEEVVSLRVHEIRGRNKNWLMVHQDDFAEFMKNHPRNADNVKQYSFWNYETKNA